MPLSRNDKIKLSLLVALWLAVFSPIVPEMVGEWGSHSDNNHGFLVPLVTLYFLWHQKGELSAGEIDCAKWGGVILAASLAIYLVSFAGGAAFPARIAMVASLFGLLWFCLGNAWIRVMAFPVLFLLFMVPVPYSVMSLVSMPLQLIATRLSAWIIQMCAIPVYREGNMLYFVGTQLEVAEACSGIRSIMSLTMLGSIFAYLAPVGWQRRALIVVAAVPIAMTANIIRISGTGILANYFGDRVARGFLHDFSGLAVFAFGLLMLWMIHLLLTRKVSHDRN
ncbi:exosortase/archaeosortase family protein [Geomonas oryzisoli]|uniref:Exosortase/archaeosortase family protein n=1 Tax=Geomonas oryzisoli TaxID=2847992 RepID=A0ABX8J148_9BACT|nr:exosortase A [Geomonas oryzisoli]QWV91850.1 exosortase/archaeosortase family protein [Geomonas oryzisoli]